MLKNRQIYAFTGDFCNTREKLEVNINHLFKRLETCSCPPMSSIAPTLCAVLGIRLPAGCTSAPIEDIVTTMGKQQRICFVVIDSFGTNLWQHHKDVTPNFNTLAESHSLTILSDSPPYTPVNIATMATGKTFPFHKVRKREDAIKCETIVDVMSKCSLKTGTVAWEKSSLTHLISQSATFGNVATSNTDEEVFELATISLKEQKPDFLWIHLLDFDSISHKYGPESEESQNTIAYIDRHLGKFATLWDKYYYSALIMADHGQHKNPLPQSGMNGIHDGKEEGDFFVPLVWKVWSLSRKSMKNTDAHR